MKAAWNKFWGNVGAYWHEVAPGVKSIENIDTYYNHMSDGERAAADAVTAESWTGAAALTARNLNEGILQAGEFAGKSVWDMGIKLGEMTSLTEERAQMYRDWNTGTLESFPEDAMNALSAAQERHAMRVEEQYRRGQGYWGANLSATGLTFLNMFGIPQVYEGLSGWDLTEQRKLKKGEAKLRTIEGAVQLGGTLYGLKEGFDPRLQTGKLAPFRAPQAGLTSQQLANLEKNGLVHAEMGQLDPAQLQRLQAKTGIEHAIGVNKNGDIIIVRGTPPEQLPPGLAGRVEMPPGYDWVAHTHPEAIPTMESMGNDLIYITQSPGNPDPEMVIGGKQSFIYTTDPTTGVVSRVPVPQK